MELDAFTCHLGSEQGRLVAPDGTITYVLGSSSPGRVYELMPGDYAEIVQSADLTATSLIRVSAVLAVPKPLPVGSAWEVSLVVDGSKIARTRTGAGRRRSISDLAANVSKLTGMHEVGLRLEWVVA